MARIELSKCYMGKNMAEINENRWGIRDNVSNPIRRVPHESHDIVHTKRIIWCELTLYATYHMSHIIWGLYIYNRNLIFLSETDEFQIW